MKLNPGTASRSPPRYDRANTSWHTHGKHRVNEVWGERAVRVAGGCRGCEKHLFIMRTALTAAEKVVSISAAQANRERQPEAAEEAAAAKKKLDYINLN